MLDKHSKVGYILKHDRFGQGEGRPVLSVSATLAGERGRPTIRGLIESMPNVAFSVPAISSNTSALLHSVL